MGEMILPSTENIHFKREHLGPLWDDLKIGIWHATGVENFSKILSDQTTHPCGDSANKWVSFFSS